MPTALINISTRNASFFAGFLVLYQFLTYIANDMIMPAMVSIVSSFHGSDADVATSLTAYVLGGASLQIFLGPLADRFGRRPIMLAGVLLFVFFTIVITGAQNIEQFFVARFFQGMGLCFISVVGYATIQEIFAEMDAVRIISLLANLASLAPLLGPLAGALFIAHFVWQGIFIVIGIFALIALWGLWRFMPETVGTERLDQTIIEAQPLNFASVFQKYWCLLKSPIFLSGAVALGLVCLPIIAWIALSPVMIIKVSHLSVYDYALWQLPVFAAGVAGNLVLRKLTYYCNLKKMIEVGLSISACGLALCYILPVLIAPNFVYLLPGLMVYSFGAGIITGPLNRKVLFSTPISKGTVSALTSLISMAIQAVGIEVASFSYRSQSTPHFGLFCLLTGVVLIGVICLHLYCFNRQTTAEKIQILAN